MHYKTVSADGLLMLFLENFCSLRVTGAVYHTHHRESLFLLSSVFPMLLKAIQRRTTVFISVQFTSSQRKSKFSVGIFASFVLHLLLLL